MNQQQAPVNFVEVFDPEFKFVKEVPSELVVHLPPARLNITRLVFCRNYQPGEPSSCTMGDGCKFVHANVDPATLESHPIHVKYAWRHEDLCTYARLPAGETLRVTAPNNRPPVEEIPSERVLVTRGSLKRHENSAPLSHCAHYYFNRMCNRGERCHFVHVVHVDANVAGDFKRAPARCVVTAPRPQRAATTKRGCDGAHGMPTAAMPKLHFLEDTFPPLMSVSQHASMSEFDSNIVNNNFAPLSFTSSDASSIGGSQCTSCGFETKKVPQKSVQFTRSHDVDLTNTLPQR